jgi:hypothetical protein
MLEDLPALNIGYRALIDNIDGLVSSGLVERETRAFQKRKRSYFRVAQAYYDKEAALDFKAAGRCDNVAEEPSQVQKTSLVPVQETAVAQVQETSQDRFLSDRKLETGESIADQKASAMAPAAPSSAPSLPFADAQEKTILEQLQETAYTFLETETPYAALAEKLVLEGEPFEIVNQAWAILLQENPAAAAFFNKDYATRWKRKVLKAHRERAGSRREREAEETPEVKEREREAVEKRRRLLEERESAEGRALIEACSAALPWRRQRAR